MVSNQKNNNQIKNSRLSESNGVASVHDEPTAKLLQVYKFLQDLNLLRNPVQKNIREQPWVYWLHQLPEHKAIQLGQYDENDQDNNLDDDKLIKQYGDTQERYGYVLKVKRPEISDPPIPPVAILPWLEGYWRNIEAEVSHKASITVSGDDGIVHEEFFNDDLERVQEYDAWINQRNNWVEKEAPARKAMAVFEKLYQLKAQLDREGESFELVYGDGLLSWSRPDGDVYHPIHLQRVQLLFDPDVPEFTIEEIDFPVELYTALFRSLPEVNASSIGLCRDELEKQGWHPIEGANTDSFYKRLAVQITPQGQFVDTFSDNIEHPEIKREPALFLRKRNLGFGSAIESIINDLPRCDELPPSLTSVVGVESAPINTNDKELDQGGSFHEVDENILLTKPANKEQLAIAKRLQSQGAVLVQGPPGTGKTHTIGNLIGHLLAQGKSILVTSHTSKALKVVKDQIDNRLQPLCVSVLDDSSKQMSKSVERILERLFLDNSDTLNNNAKELLKERNRLIKKLEEARAELRDFRNDEYRPIVYAGQEITPTDAARTVAEGRDTDSWIPSPVQLGAPIPLTESELVELYRSNILVTPEDEYELQYDQPSLDCLLKPSDFNVLIDEIEKTKMIDTDYKKDLWYKSDDKQIGDLLEIHDFIKEAISILYTEYDWQMDALTAGKSGVSQSEVWYEFISKISGVYQYAKEKEGTFKKYKPHITGEIDPKTVRGTIKEIIDYLDNGGKLNKVKLSIKPSWKKLLQTVRVNGDVPSEKEHFRVLFSYLVLQLMRRELIAWWQRFITDNGGLKVEDLGDRPEIYCYQVIPEIKKHLDWHQETWVKLEDRLVELGLNWDQLLNETKPNLSRNGELLRIRDLASNELPNVIIQEINRRKVKECLNKLYVNVEYLTSCDTSDGASNVIKNIKSAAMSTNVADYETAFRALVKINNLQALLNKRKDLIKKLEKVAPAWASAIANRKDIHGHKDLPGKPIEAWRWKQLNDELEQRVSNSIEKQQIAVVELNEKLRDVTAELVDNKTWFFQKNNTTLAQRQALQGWVKTEEYNIGSGSRKRAPILKAQARQLMQECQSAVPVWVMPLNRVVESFDPKTIKFDVVIIDEASQADLMALIAVYMGKQVIIVGDHEQVSPIAVGFKTEDIQHLIDEHLNGIPNKQLYDGQFSIYDLAQTSYEPICLREHFRCVEPIIRYSNYLSYEGKILPLRDASEVRTKPHTVAYRVEGAFTANKINEKEALETASLLAASIEQPEYKGATFGVISMVGEEQARYIEDILRKHLTPNEFINRKIQCGNSAQFQGDERDVVFLSMVDSPPESPPLKLRKAESNNKLYQKRFNVAFSRARDQVWVIHSVDPFNDLQEADIRRHLILYAKDPEASSQRVAEAEQRTQSEFERIVIKRLIEKGYKVIPQWPVGALRIDMMVKYRDKNIAIECDGDKYHPQEKLAEDMARQAILERLGLRFIRIRGSEFFINPDNAMARVYKRLDELGILSTGVEENEVKWQSNELLERIIRRADELRREWVGELPTYQNSQSNESEAVIDSRKRNQVEIANKEYGNNIQRNNKDDISDDGVKPTPKKRKKITTVRHGEKDGIVDKNDTKPIQQKLFEDGEQMSITAIDQKSDKSNEKRRNKQTYGMEETTKKTLLDEAEKKDNSEKVGTEVLDSSLMTYEEFVKKAIERLRDLSKSKGIHTVFSGFNKAFKEYYNENPIPITQELAEKGLIDLRPVKGGVMIYLSGEGPTKQNINSDNALNKILSDD